jgi:PAS domain S-box-containing protein
VSEWQEIERAVSEEVLRQMPAGVVIAEAPSGRIIFVNGQAQQWTERSRGRARATKLEDAGAFQIFHPDGRPYEMEEWPLMRSIRDGKEVRNEEFVYPLTDGTGLLLRCNSSPVYDDEGRIVAGVLVAQDITEQKRAEEERAYHAHLLENIHDAVMATDEHLLITAWNKGAEEVYGWRADEVLGRNLWEAVPSDLSEEQRAEALRELAERGRFRTEATTYGKDGTPVYVEGITIALRGGEQGEGEITGYVNIRRDITERKRAEEELRESSRRTEDILESITDAFYAVDRDWRYTYINERALHLLQWAKEDEGLTREYLLGKNMWEVFPEAVSTVFYDIYHEAVREQKVVDLEEYYSPSDVWVEVHAYPFEGGLAFYWRAITERKQAEEEREREARPPAGCGG